MGFEFAHLTLNPLRLPLIGGEIFYYFQPEAGPPLADIFLNSVFILSFNNTKIFDNGLLTFFFFYDYIIVFSFWEHTKLVRWLRFFQKMNEDDHSFTTGESDHVL